MKVYIKSLAGSSFEIEVGEAVNSVFEFHQRVADILTRLSYKTFCFRQLALYYYDSEKWARLTDMSRVQEKAEIGYLIHHSDTITEGYRKEFNETGHSFIYSIDEPNCVSLDYDGSYVNRMYINYDSDTKKYSVTENQDQELGIDELFESIEGLIERVNSHKKFKYKMTDETIRNIIHLWYVYGF
uniref:Uncharacterized protein n=1 Tax=viral metagenome TaxID=1070528 RepID=A0A6C0KI09_9ZZZZ